MFCEALLKLHYATTVQSIEPTLNMIIILVGVKNKYIYIRLCSICLRHICLDLYSVDIRCVHVNNCIKKKKLGIVEFINNKAAYSNPVCFIYVTTVFPLQTFCLNS